eukprot:TRINITY_DN19861_c0_g1_i1.p1 TRINITY_DN19861_c0_g1~~TRINITY_DN19861_c0_g1_i1.p1  ORF type:complete len:455 (-),score=94.09 TRINITY_DN19861_c0_g1_i1:822-2186(-)
MAMEGTELTREQVLKRDIRWDIYMTAKLITGTGLQLLRRYDHKSKEVQAGLLNEDGAAYVKTFLMVIKNLGKEETIEYTLALIDDMLAVDPSRAKLFHDKSLAGEDIYGPFLRLLQKKNWFILEKTSKILTLVLSARPKFQPGSGTGNGPSSSAAPPVDPADQVLSQFVDWLVGQLKHPSNASKGVPTAVGALSILLRETQVRALFVKSDAIKQLGPLIVPASSQQHMQLLYEAILSVWLLSFYEPAIEAISSGKIVPRLIDVAKSSTKEKVVRVAVLTLRNLEGKGNIGYEMVELGFPKVIASLKLQAWTDEDLTEALDSLEESLKGNIRVLSSWDKYKQEVLSGTLDWTPIHKNAAFWRENVTRFEDGDFQVLRVLVTLLDTSGDKKTIAVACYDLGQFIENHPAGRGILRDLKAKERVIKHMTDPDPEVQKQALLCVQKLLLSAKYVSYMQ